MSQWVFGVYNYEGGDRTYVLTAGDRSITDPEPYGQDAETEIQTDTNTGNILLYVGVGLVALAAIGAVAVIGLKKKKTGAKTKE